MNLNEIAHDMRETARKREENGGVKADSKSLFKHLATEVIESAEAFFFFDNEISREPGEIYLPPDDLKTEHRENLAGELADVICCALIISANEGINIEKALEDCLYKNKKRARFEGDKL